MVALDTRMSASRLNRDIALKQFLLLLQWLRAVLLQDCALLYARYPMCPIFRFAPFTFPSFVTFSANATAVVTTAEETARLAFHNLPDYMARSMRGYASDLQMRQEQNHSKVCEELRELREQNVRLELLLSNKGLRKGSKAKNSLSPSLFRVLLVRSTHFLNSIASPTCCSTTTSAAIAHCGAVYAPGSAYCAHCWPSSAITTSSLHHHQLHRFTICTHHGQHILFLTSPTTAAGS
jgi:hypothetical protein